jgi:hypothetical protein
MVQNKLLHRTDVQKCFKQQNTSPLSNAPLDHKLLIPNMTVRQRIIAWREEQGIPLLCSGRLPDVSRPSPSSTQRQPFKSPQRCAPEPMESMYSFIYIPPKRFRKFVFRDL